MKSGGYNQCLSKKALSFCMMSQRVHKASKLKMQSEASKFVLCDPKLSELSMNRLKANESWVEDQSHTCCKMLMRFVESREKRIELRDSWFSTKTIEVERMHKLYTL